MGDVPRQGAVPHRGAVPQRGFAPHRGDAPAVTPRAAPRDIGHAVAAFR